MRGTTNISEKSAVFQITLRSVTCSSKNVFQKDRFHSRLSWCWAFPIPSHFHVTHTGLYTCIMHCYHMWIPLLQQLLTSMELHMRRLNVLKRSGIAYISSNLDHQLGDWNSSDFYFLSLTHILNCWVFLKTEPFLMITSVWFSPLAVRSFKIY